MNEKEKELDLIPDEVLTNVAACLKVMAHPLRLRIIDILMHGDFAVYEIASICGLKHHQACEHLRHMQSCGFLKSERKGRLVYYSIAFEQLPALMHCIRTACMKPVSE